MNEQNMQNFRQLLMTAMGTYRSQTQFAADCGISRIHLGRMLKEDYDSIPSLATLEKIADHSAGKVSLADLKKSLGLAVTEEDERKEDFYRLPYTRRNAIQAENLRRGIRELTEKAQKYLSVFYITEILEMLYTWGNVTFFYDDDNILPESEGTQHHGAEYYTNLYARWNDDDCSVKFGCMLFYCKTVSDGIIITDAVFDVKTLYKYNNEVAKEIKDGLTCGDEEINPDDYSLCYTTLVKNHDNGVIIDSSLIDGYYKRQQDKLLKKLNQIATDDEKKVLDSLVKRLATTQN